jgi:hypothetical protein
VASGGTGTTTSTGTGSVVLSTSPSLTTPSLGVASATSINKVTITAPTTSATLTLVTGSSLITAGAFALTLKSTAATNATFPAGTITLMDLGTAQSVSGVKTYNSSALKMKGSSTGTTTIASANDSTTSYTLTIPAITGTVVTTTATLTAGAIAYGTGTALAFSAAGTAGQALLSGGAGVPTWGAAGATLTDDSTTATALNLVLTNLTSGSMTAATVSSSKLTFAPASGILKAGIYTNPTTISSTYTIGNGSGDVNAMSAGPITIADGYTVTVASGSVWTII